MTQFETLYNYIPPSILKKEKGFIPADVNPLFMSVFDRIFAYILKKNFATIRVKNLHYYNLRDKSKGNIFYAPHQCWWDGMIGYYLGRKVFKTNMRMMVEDLPSFPVLSKIGAFSVSKNDLSSTIKSLKYVIDYLREEIGSVWIFPQGIINPPDYRPIEFESGIAYICQKMQGVNLFPLAIRYEFLRYDKPEILIELAKPIVLKASISDRKKFNLYLQRQFERKLSEQQREVSSGKLDSYVKILERGDSLLNYIEKKFKSFGF